jgi:hypothetical protein
VTSQTMKPAQAAGERATILLWSADANVSPTIMTTANASNATVKALSTAARGIGSATHGMAIPAFAPGAAMSAIPSPHQHRKRQEARND